MQNARKFISAMAKRRALISKMVSGGKIC